MKLKRIWIVTNPSLVSEIGDICFSADAHRMALQFIGGLDPKDIHGMYTTEKEATDIAKWLLHLRDEREA